MARLTGEQWEQAKAEYEVRGVSFGDISKRFGVNVSSVSRRAKAEGWTQGKMQGLAERKVNVLKELAQVETQTQDLPLRFQVTLDDVVKERLEADRLLVRFDKSLLLKAQGILEGVKTPEEWETMTRGRRNLAPLQERGTTVNVSQQASAQATSVPAPDSALRDALRGSYEAD